MTDQPYKPAEISLGMVSLLWNMRGDVLSDVVKELVKHEDIPSLEVVLGSEIVRDHAWADLPFHLLPLKDSSNARARELYETWAANLGANTPEKLGQRLLDLTSLVDRWRHVDDELVSEVVEIMNLGGDIEMQLAPAGRTILGEALWQRRTSTSAAMLTEFAKRSPDRLPLAAKGRDVVSYLASKLLANFDTREIFKRINDLYDFTRAEHRSGVSKVVSKLTKPEEGVQLTEDEIKSLATLVALKMLDASAVQDLWNMTVEKGLYRTSFLSKMAKLSKSSEGELMTAALQGFIESGININAKLSDTAIPIDHAIKSGAPDFLCAVLAAGVDVPKLREKMLSDSTYLKGATEQTAAALHAFLARDQVTNIAKTGARASV